MCYGFFGNSAEAEDAVQATFMKLVERPREFEDERHERAWLIVVASNVCRDTLKSPGYARVVSLADRDVEDPTSAEAVDETLDAVLRLPERYKDVVFLYYYEGYKTAEIAELLGAPPSTIRNRLSDARKLLRAALGGGENG